MKDIIPARRPSPIALAAFAFAAAVHLILMIAVWSTPVPERDPRGTYDYLSSTVFEILGLQNVVYLYDVRWPGAGDAETPACGDPESALDGLGGGDRPWCSPDPR